MRLETFFEKFDQFVEAPNAITKIRELVLELAVCGKLSSPFPGDLAVPSYRDLNKQVFQLSALLGLRAQKETSEEVELPFEVPEHWSWFSLGDVGVSQTGTTPSKNDHDAFNGEIPFIKPADIFPDIIRYDNESLTRRGAESGSRLAPAGSLLMVCIGTIGKCNLIDRECSFNQQINSLTPVDTIDPRFLLFAVRAPYFQRLAWEKSSSTTIAIINKGKWISIPVPVPPLAEQKRIVAKVDELMMLCDRMEVQQQERDTRHAALARAALARFADTPTLANLNLLFYPSYSIVPADIRNTILTLAVQGKLVSQDADDEPVESSFAGIKSFDAETADYVEVPTQWALCTYRTLTSLVTSGSRGWKEYYSESGAIFIRTQNIKTDRLLLDDVAFVQLPKSAEGMRAQVMKNDIMITITGANVTKAACVEEQIPEAYISQHIALTRPRWPEMSKWLHLCFMSHGAARGTLEQLAYGDKPGLNLNNIRDLVLPIPPLAEQRRIVAKVDQLMTLVDQLETQLTASRTAAVNLMEAVVAELTVVDRP